MPPRLWPAIDLQAPLAMADAEREDLQGRLLAALDDAAVTAVEETPTGWRLFFNAADARDSALASLAAWSRLVGVSAVDVSDEDWARRSQEGLVPVRVGRVRISPPWRAADVDGPASGSGGAPIDIVIQPSMGFGTGHHATTRLCTALLQRIDLAGRRVLDIGTGSGVLAIVASRLGAQVVLGIDDDADALESARENLELNAITSGIVLRQSDFRSLRQSPFDVVTANLTGGLLVRGADAILRSVAPGGRLLLSGITLDEETEVRSRFEGALPLVERREEDGWIGLLLGSD